MQNTLLTLCILIVLVSLADAQTVLYVAPNGNDSWSGTRKQPTANRSDGPMATLARAVARSRELRAIAPSKPIRILLRGGKHYLNSTLELNAADSGLVIEAAPGEQPVLIGGRRLTGWRREGERFWSVPIPEARGRAWDFRLLTVNGEMRPRARLPETGYFTHLTRFDVPWMSTSGGGWQRKPTDEELTRLQYRPGDLDARLDIASAELTVYHMWDESVVGLSAHDPATQTLTFSNPAGHPPGAFRVQKYVVWNVREGMKKPGQWYLDRTAGKLVYWPLPGEDMSKAEVLAPTLTSLVRIQGSENSPANAITLRGLSLTITTTPLKAGGFGAGEFAGAVEMVYASDCRLEQLSLINIAGQAIRAWKTDRLRVERCEIRDVGACGIRAVGDGMEIADNHVYRIGALYPSAVGIWIGGNRSTVRHNEVHDTPYSAIIGGGEENRIEFNLIYRAMQTLHDGAGIYFTFCKGIVIRGNIVRDIVDTGGYGASAYYLDEQAEDCLVEGNLSVNVARPAHNHMARNNTLRNNLFLVNGSASLTFMRCEGYRLEKNIVQATGDIVLSAPPQGIASMPANLFHSGTGKVLLETMNDYQAQGRQPLPPRDGTRFSDPRWTDSKAGIYTFRPDSPAKELQIAPLDVRAAGRRKSAKESPRAAP
jgi:hypothetical protein